MEDDKDKDKKINKIFIITLVIFIIVALITIGLILSKGKIFGYRLVNLSEAKFDFLII